MAKPPSSPILHLIRRVAEDERTRGSSDEELLRHFNAGRDEGCFHALLRRHGPMVLDVCRAVLSNEADAVGTHSLDFVRC
jgi:hypothetical protein